MTVYLTSDLHLGHQLVSDLRGFATTEDHDNSVLDTLYERLRKADDLWILGDLASGGRSAEDRALSLLGLLASRTGARLHLVEGNHDSCSSVHRDGWKRQPRFLEVFDSVHAFARRRGPERLDVLLSHYPYTGDHTTEERYAYARLKDTGSWLLHGHTHHPGKISGRRSIHVGWDAWKRPVAWDEIEQIIRTVEDIR